MSFIYGLHKAIGGSIKKMSKEERDRFKGKESFRMLMERDKQLALALDELDIAKKAMEKIADYEHWDECDFDLNNPRDKDCGCSVGVVKRALSAMRRTQCQEK